MKTKQIILSLYFLCLFSCKKFIEVDTPKTQLEAGSVFTNEALVNSALANIYTNTLTYGGGGLNSVTVIATRLADETDNYSTTQGIIDLASNQILPENTYTTTLWTSAYQSIYSANVVIEGLRDNTAISEALNNRATGEALFFRAFAHLNMAMLFGRVPLVTSTDYRINTQLKQSSLSEILTAAAADLEKAKPLLPADYSGNTNERARVTRPAASALLARIYLYQGQWQKAIDESSLVIDNTALYVLTQPNDAFLKNSKEAIFQLRTNSLTLNTSDGNFFVLTGRPTQVALRSGFHTSFEPGDLRRNQWVSKITNAGTDYFFPFKYKVKTGAVLSEYSMVLRLAEQYLIRAEAYARLDELPLAIADLDKVRLRAGLTALTNTNPTISQPDLLEAILKERRFELFTEWGHRWFDLKRSGKLDAIVGSLKTGWKATAKELPLPRYEITVNRNLVQNDGY